MFHVLVGGGVFMPERGGKATGVPAPLTLKLAADAPCVVASFFGSYEIWWTWQRTLGR